jgi:hypothetical protein
MDMRAVRRLAARRDAHPQEALLAEPHHQRRAGIADDHSVATHRRNVLQQPLRAERTHAFLVAGERQDHLAAPRVGVRRQCNASATIDAAMPPFMSAAPRPYSRPSRTFAGETDRRSSQPDHPADRCLGGRSTPHAAQGPLPRTTATRLPIVSELRYRLTSALGTRSRMSSPATSATSCVSPAGSATAHRSGAVRTPGRGPTGGRPATAFAGDGRHHGSTPASKPRGPGRPGPASGRSMDQAPTMVPKIVSVRKREPRKHQIHQSNAGAASPPSWPGIVRCNVPATSPQHQYKLRVFRCAAHVYAQLPDRWRQAMSDPRRDRVDTAVYAPRPHQQWVGRARHWPYG